MAGKLFNLYTLPASFYLESSPVMLSGGSLFLNCRSEDLSVCLNIKNVSESEITSVTVCIKLFDAKGVPVGENIQYSYSLLKLKRDDEFGGRKYISVPENETRSFSAYVSQVIFSDYSTWENSEPFLPVGKAVSLDTALENEETARQFAARYGNDCKFMPYTDRDLWFCTCGAVNTSDEIKCHNCMRKRDGFQTINVNELSLEAQRRKAREAREAEEKRSRIERKRNRSRKILKIALIILPILMVAALVLATIPPFIARRDTYSAAGELLKAKKFDEARSAYAALGDYLDSADLADRGILYEKASFVMACANDKNREALTYVGLSETDIGQSDDLGMVLYAKAKDLFLELGDYKDSLEKIAEIDSAIARYNDGLVLDAYNQAFDKLERYEYLCARDAFSVLGDYRDSEEMKIECIYRRALAILDFCKNNNVRDIFVSISNEQTVRTKVSMPASVLTSLGEVAIGQLEACFSGDGIDFLYEDGPSDVAFLPICDAVAAEFSSMGEYKDSMALAEQAKEVGNFAAEFYSLLKEGKLKSAVSWLDAYDDEIPNRGDYYSWLNSYISYCDSWELYKGDSSLIPYSVGVNNKKAVSFTPTISIDGTLVTMTISSEDDSFSVRLTSELGETNFQAKTEESAFYYAVINQLDHFTYLHYSADGKVLSSCEYKRAD